MHLAGGSGQIALHFLRHADPDYFLKLLGHVVTCGHIVATTQEQNEKSLFDVFRVRPIGLSIMKTCPNCKAQLDSGAGGAGMSVDGAGHCK